MLDAHMDGPVLFASWKSQFRKRSFKDFVLSNQIPNNCCKIKNDIVIVENLVKTNSGSEIIVGRKFLNCSDLSIQPCLSSTIGIYMASNLSALIVWPINEDIIKCMCLPLHDDENTFSIIPLLHSV